MSEQATPLIDLLRQVPRDHRTAWEVQWDSFGRASGHAMCPIGLLCHQAADRLVELAAEQSPWVSVDDRLPEDRQPVLVGFHSRGTAMQATYFADGGFSVYPAGQVTHWMPIPPLPDKE